MLNVAILIAPYVGFFDGHFNSSWSKAIGTRCLLKFTAGQLWSSPGVFNGLGSFLRELPHQDVTRVLVWHIGDTVDDQKLFENVQEIIVCLQAQGIDCDHQLIPKELGSGQSKQGTQKPQALST